MRSIYLLADKNNDGTFSATEFHSNKTALLEGLEYSDVLNGEFQIWEYPSGNIYDVRPDREITDNNYSVAGSDKWLTVLRYNSMNPELVHEGYSAISK